MSGRSPPLREKPWKTNAGIAGENSAAAFTTSPQHFAPWRTTGRRSSAASASCARKAARIASGMVRDLSRSSPISPTPADGSAASRSRRRSSQPSQGEAPSRKAQGWTPKNAMSPSPGSPPKGSQTKCRSAPVRQWQWASVMTPRARRRCPPARACGRGRPCRRRARRCRGRGPSRPARRGRRCSPA